MVSRNFHDQKHKIQMKFQGQTNVAKQKAITDFTSYLIDVVWDGRLWYTCTNLTNDCSHQRSLTEGGKTGNIYVT